MPTLTRRAALLLLAVALGSRPATAADARAWKVEPEGVTFEVTPTDLRAWAGSKAGPPVFSMAALLAAEKKEFDQYARELADGLAGPDAPTYGEYTYDQRVTLEVLSVVGPLVSYRDSGGGYAPGTAHPSGYDLLKVRDVRRNEASPSLLDFFPEGQLVAALKADPWVRRFANPEKGFDRAASLKDLLEALDPDWAQENAESTDHDCSVDVSFDDSIARQFFFHHLAKDRVAVRIAVGPGSEWCNRVEGPQQIGVLLPIPASLRDHLTKAQRGEAGFLAGNRKTAGSPSYSESWEVDIRTLVRKP